MATTASNLGATFLEKFIDTEIQIEFNDSTEAYQDFDEVTVAWDGAAGILSLNTERNSSVGASSGVITPPAGQEGYDRMVIGAKRVYGTNGIDGPTLAQAKKKGPNVLAPQIMTMGIRLMKDFQKKLTEYVFTGGPFAGYVWQLQNAVTFQYRGRFKDIAVNGEIPGICQVRLIRTDLYTQVGIDTQVDLINGTTLTLNAPINTSLVPIGVPMVVQIVGAQAALSDPVQIVGKTIAAVTMEPQGFIGNMSNPNLFGINRALVTPAAEVMRGNFRNASGGSVLAPLGFGDLDEDLANIMTRIGERPTKRWLSWVSLNAYKTLLQGTFVAGTSANNVRMDASNKPTRLGVGVEQIKGDAHMDKDGVPFFCSDVCPNGIIFTTNIQTYVRAQLGEGAWVGSELGLDAMQRVQNSDSFTQTWRQYYDLVCKKPAANGVITAFN